jgi:DNA-binding NarL/FixJ family response regulator
METRGVIRLVVVDDQELMRDGLIAILERQEGIAVVGSAADGLEALQVAETLTPDVILMDVRMPVMDGVQATVELRRRWPDIKVLMLTTFDDDTYIVAALRAGAAGYMLKTIPAQDLAAAVRLAHRGVVQLDPVVAAKIAGALGAPPGPATLVRGMKAPLGLTPAAERLTEREQEVMLLVARGANNREIAEQLVISEATVKSHISSILSQLGLRDRTQIAVFAHQQRAEQG